MTNVLDIEITTRIRSRSDVNYRILQLLGSGGNSVVYLALALNGTFRGVLFALKLFTRLSDPERLDKFQQEAEFLRKCDHPTIMRVYDDGVYEEGKGEHTRRFPFVVAEFLPFTIHDLIGQKITTAEKISFTLQMLSALSFLDEHDPPVVHRDIKPRNIFVKGKSCVLGDFGLMKFLDKDAEVDRQTYKESVLPGMPFLYRTPDLVAYARNQADISTKSDVYQLGLVVAEIFTGKNPQIKAKHFLAQVRLYGIADIAGRHSVIIREFIETMLESNPENRPSAADLIDRWEGVFRDVVDQCHQLEGRVF
jgi:serine/threonine protein kinase